MARARLACGMVLGVSDSAWRARHRDVDEWWACVVRARAGARREVYVCAVAARGM